MSQKIKFVFTDIDDTLTDEGRLGPFAYEALWRLYNSGVKVVPVTGRPAGWCEMIARMWPVEGVIGENGGLYFRYERGEMKRHFSIDKIKQRRYRKILDEVIAPEILKKVKGSAIASDQFSRLMDLAIDFCEDVKPLEPESVLKIVEIFHSHGANAKVSSIHVNGWFGDYDKLTMVLIFLKKEFSMTQKEALASSAYVGDSPNDEPMFQFFKNTYGVANILKFKNQIKHMPAYIASKNGGAGFMEVVQTLLRS